MRQSLALLGFSSRSLVPAQESSSFHLLSLCSELLCSTLLANPVLDPSKRPTVRFGRANVSLRRGGSRLSENARRVLMLEVELSPRRRELA
ncbi:hypothetical protein DEO72_LG6g1779 [Vigna unguiculata]|uniref:Uncharacterized protein n=1 Tax=Vigna unguiculata TaxID=3917 RepID=A0A4D6M6Q5_VIGUN|nr:hypothetical protein DEO72_LG6g1779 [Vigna unguiculata]